MSDKNKQLLTLAELLPTIVHDLNNFMATIVTHHGLIEESVQDDDWEREEILSSLRAMERKEKELIQVLQLVGILSKPPDIQMMEPVVVENVLSAAVLLLGKLARLKKIELKAKLDQETSVFSSRTIIAAVVVFTLVALMYEWPTGPAETKPVHLTPEATPEGAALKISFKDSPCLESLQAHWAGASAGNTGQKSWIDSFLALKRCVDSGLIKIEFTQTPQTDEIRVTFLSQNPT